MLQKLDRALLLTVVATLLVLAASAAPAGAAVMPQIASGSSATCVLNDAAAIFCVGSNASGQLGDATVHKRSSYAPGPSLPGVIQLAAGDQHFCALLGDGTVRCWGEGDNWRLGKGQSDTVDSATPVTVLTAPATPLGGVTQISTTAATTCARRNDGTAWCWGAGSSGMIGDGGYLDRGFATQVSGLTGVVKVSAGVDASCALVAGGEAWCWGDNYGYALGIGAAPSSATPVKVVGLSGAVDIGSGADFSCALTTDRAVKCWGTDEFGEQGNGSGRSDNATATTMIGLNRSGITQLGVGHTNTCVLDSMTLVRCWGSARLGGLPRPVTTGMGAIAITQQWGETGCVVNRGGEVKCWGQNDFGQAGISNGLGELGTPTTVPDLDLVTLPYAAGYVAFRQFKKPLLEKGQKRVVVSLMLRLTPHPFVASAEACTGSVSASATRTWRAKRKKKHVKRHKTYKASGTLLPGRSCKSQVKLKLPAKYFAGKRVKVELRAAGNDSLLTTTTSQKIKLPSVKKKKAKKKNHKKK